ncbi:sporulation protein YunB [Virgibacillus ndiopensis]|uniref:sporulation protein YunB n=1 Tax=Virgibacillus ndiopensis TaxID=2004408 RepID=UPI000C08145C|nr:sporulation protein YunB [Virgibacillus ndiopensis]
MVRKRTFFRKKGSPPPVKNILVITVILFVVMILISIQIINKGIKPTLMEIAKVKTTEFATRGINAAVKFAENYRFDDVMEMTKDNEGNFSTINFNSSVVSKINRVATDRVEAFFRSMNRGEPPNYDDLDQAPIEYSETAEDLPEKDPTVVEIPIGQATGNTILANLGPKIPVNLELVGNVRTDVILDDKPIGISGSWYELYIIVEVDVQIVIPFTTDIEKVSTKIYIDSGGFMRDVPDYYGGGNNGPDIAVPEEDLKDEE